jgi:hypothetical protein
MRASEVAPGSVDLAKLGHLRSFQSPGPEEPWRPTQMGLVDELSQQTQSGGQAVVQLSG